MIDRNHPAVEAVAREIYVHDAPSNDPQTWPPTPTALADDYRGAAIAALTAALPHLVSPDDPRPWEPLAPGDPLHAGDEVWRWWCGVSTRGTFDVQHPDSQVYTAERGHLGHRAIGTWCVRRRIPAPTPPPGGTNHQGEMMSKKKPAGRVWADGDGDEFLVRVPHEAPTTRSAALVATPGDVVYLTAAQCREVAAHLTALADAHEHDDGPMSAADYADQEDTRP